MKSSFHVTLNIPDKEPFEGKATQRQKQRIWELGYQDEDMIKQLGKKQASAVISQITRAYQKEHGRRSAVRMFLYAASSALVVIGISLYNIYSESPNRGSSSTLILLACVGLTPYFLVIGAYRWIKK